MNQIRYLLDENVSPLYRTELGRREPTMVVWKIGDPGLPPKGTSDPDILCWCEEQIKVKGSKGVKSALDSFANLV